MNAWPGSTYGIYWSPIIEKTYCVCIRNGNKELRILNPNTHHSYETRDLNFKYHQSMHCIPDHCMLHTHNESWNTGHEIEKPLRINSKSPPQVTHHRSVSHALPRYIQCLVMPQVHAYLLSPLLHGHGQVVDHFRFGLLTWQCFCRVKPLRDWVSAFRNPKQITNGGCWLLVGYRKNSSGNEVKTRQDQNHRSDPSIKSSPSTKSTRLIQISDTSHLISSHHLWKTKYHISYFISEIKLNYGLLLYN